MAALLGTWLIPRYSDRTGDRRNVAAVTLLAAGIGIGLSGLVSPVLAILALCVAAVGFIGRSARILDHANAATFRYGSGGRNWFR